MTSCKKHISSTFIHCNEKVQTATYQDKRKHLKKNKTMYYTRKEIQVHNKPDDCWVSFLGLVRDLTPLSYEYIGRREMTPIYANAGKDISHWFDERTGDVSLILCITFISTNYLSYLNTNCAFKTLYLCMHLFSVIYKEVYFFEHVCFTSYLKAIQS